MKTNHWGLAQLIKITVIAQEMRRDKQEKNLKEDKESTSTRNER
jgi:hypothetical protein